MLTRREVLRRIECAVAATGNANRKLRVPNSGLLHGILERAISPFIDEIKG